VERSCLCGDEAVDDFIESNLQRDSLFEGRCEESEMRKKTWTTSPSQNLQRVSLFEGRCEESIKRKSGRRHVPAKVALNSLTCDIIVILVNIKKLVI
jgi:hypothetical protein